VVNVGHHFKGDIMKKIKGLFINSENKTINEFLFPKSWGRKGNIQPTCLLDNGDALYIVEAEDDRNTRFKLDGVCDIRGNAFIIGLCPCGNWTTAKSGALDVPIEFVWEKDDKKAA
jgi:hypothetical protein